MTQAAAPLVMLHGWALNLRVFDDLIVRLQTPSGTAPHGRARSLLRLDLPGHGRASEPPALYGGDPEGPWDLGAVADHLLAQLPPRCALLGWSLGAKIALEIAARAISAARCASSSICRCAAAPTPKRPSQRCRPHCGRRASARPTPCAARRACCMPWTSGRGSRWCRRRRW